jgi:UDP-N-acetylmuramoylalanine--D-glutamate ligase
MEKSLYLVVGLGKTGYSIARHLQRRNISFAVFDTRSSLSGLEDFHRDFSPVDVFLGNLPADIYNKITAVITSPGVDLNLPEMQKFYDLGVPVYGDIECFAKEVQSPVIAITGTNGKSTVTTLVGEMAKNFDVSVAVAGNIGNPVLDLLDDEQQYGLWVLELSSFQLSLTSSLKPVVSTILNISADHLDRHKTLENYVEAKQRVYKNSTFLLYNREDKFTVPEHKNEFANEYISSYGLDAPEDGHWGLLEVDGTIFIAHGSDCLMPINLVKIKGRHNWINVLASCALAHIAGISDIAICEALKQFSGLPHRTQWLRTLDNVAWIDDSKGTNIGATVAAISGLGDSIDGQIILIAGGQGKGADFTELKPAVEDYVKSIILIGEDADMMEKSLGNKVDIIHAESIDDAVLMAQKIATPKDMVLLSPACASFDMFRDFNHRGEVFTAAVEQL